MKRKPRPVGLSEEEFEEFRDKQVLRMWRLPWGLWLLSFMCFAAGSFLLACMLFFDILDPWSSLSQHLITIAFFLAAALFYIFASIEVVTFDKESQKMHKSKWILWYKWKSYTIDLRDIVDVNLVLSGNNQKYSSTLYYKISLILKRGKPVKILETQSRSTVIDKALKLRAFFNMKGKIPLQDISID